MGPGDTRIEEKQWETWARCSNVSTLFNKLSLPGWIMCNNLQTLQERFFIFHSHTLWLSVLVWASSSDANLAKLIQVDHILYISILIHNVTMCIRKSSWLTFRDSFSMLTTILVSSHCTLWPMLRASWWSSASVFSQGRLWKEGEKSTGGGNGKGRLERPETAPSPGRGSVCRRMNRSGGNMLFVGSTTTGWHSYLVILWKYIYCLS